MRACLPPDAGGIDRPFGPDCHGSPVSHDAPNIPEVIARFNQRLAEAGLKSTRQRDAIVERFFRIDKHISVEELLEDVRRVSPRIGYATVYRTLRLLVEYKFAEPRQFGDGQTRFDPVFGEGAAHDHVICIDCRRVLEFTDEIINVRIGQVVSQLGTFQLTRQRLELYARCTNMSCAHRASRPALADDDGDDD